MVRLGARINWLGWTELRSAAWEFLAKHDPDGAIPVPIEWIVERLGIDIVPVPGLLRGRGINGFLCADQSTLYVDDWIYAHVENRYRFTLAHEIAHLVLHAEQFLKFTRYQEWLDFHRDLPPAEIASAEWQANMLAGLILVPDATLPRIAKERFDDCAAQILRTAPDFDLTSAAFWETVGHQVGQVFIVSDDTARIRLTGDELWGRNL